MSDDLGSVARVGGGAGGGPVLEVAVVPGGALRISNAGVVVHIPAESVGWFAGAVGAVVGGGGSG